MEFTPKRIPNTPAYQRARGECWEQRVFAVVFGAVVVVFGAVVAVVVVFGAVVVVFGAVVSVVVFGAVVSVVVFGAVEILTIKVTHSSWTFIHPLD